MLLSMTGYGDGRLQQGGVHVSIEVRSVNNRHLKVTARGSEPYPMLEADLEKVVRRKVKRGTVLVLVRVVRPLSSSNLTLNTAALEGYLRQVREACQAAGSPELAPSVSTGALALPGVAPEDVRSGSLPEGEWPLVEKALDAALDRLNASRSDEGRAMARELLSLHRTIGEQLDAVRGHIPAVTADYRARILDRVRAALSEGGLAVEPEHLIREVALFADRTDVAEEVMRLSSHLDQFAEVVAKGEEGAGRRLEFVLQEMGREVNTMGSKAGNVAISRHVIEIKACLEKVRELIQNIE